MRIETVYSAEEITELAKARFKEERAVNRLEGWFLAREIAMECDRTFASEPDCIRIGRTLVEVMTRIPLTLGDYHLFAGSQDDAFARSYALINPSFEVKSFEGYCDPVQVFGDISPIGDITAERIEHVKDYYSKNDFAKTLTAAYASAETYTEEVIFFMEQVTGHVVPDVRDYLKRGALAVRRDIEKKQDETDDAQKKQYYEAMKYSIDALLVLAGRYQQMAQEKADASEGKTKERYQLMADTLQKVPAYGAGDLYEAIQSFILIWQNMTVEQTPNPFALSVGNADRIFEPYRAAEDTGRDMTAALLKHLLVFFNVADRSWAISQSLLVGGKDRAGNDLTNATSYALFDAYFDMNLPQPILSVKLHKNTPEKLYEEMGKFFFTPGVLTPPCSTTTPSLRCCGAGAWMRRIWKTTPSQAARSR